MTTMFGGCRDSALPRCGRRKVLQSVEFIENRVELSVNGAERRALLRIGALWQREDDGGKKGRAKKRFDESWDIDHRTFLPVKAIRYRRREQTSRMVPTQFSINDARAQ